jgi:hypothetical protein
MEFKKGTRVCLAEDVNARWPRTLGVVTGFYDLRDSLLVRNNPHLAKNFSDENIFVLVRFDGWPVDAPMRQSSIVASNDQEIRRIERAVRFLRRLL